MREFLLGMWLAIAVVAAGPAVRSFADESPAKDEKSTAAEKADDKQADEAKSADKKEADEKAVARMSDKAEAKKLKAKKEAAEKAEAKPRLPRKKPRKRSAKAEEKDADKKETKAAEKKVRIAYIIIDGALPESPGEMSLFGDLGVDLRKTMARLEKAGDDESIAGVILQIDAAPGRGKLNELRERDQARPRQGEEGLRPARIGDGPAVPTRLGLR